MWVSAPSFLDVHIETRPQSFQTKTGLAVLLNSPLTGARKVICNSMDATRKRKQK